MYGSLMKDESEPHISILTGISVGLAASFVQSLGLTIQRKSHLLNEQRDVPERKRDFQRPLWVIGFVIFIVSNVLGTVFQIGALPIVVLGPLGAVSLLYNAFFAGVILGDHFTLNLMAGTVLIAGGAVLIGIFGALPEKSHTLDELVALYTQVSFVLWFLFLVVVLSLSVGLAHAVEWYEDASLSERVRAQWAQLKNAFSRKGTKVPLRIDTALASPPHRTPDGPRGSRITQRTRLILGSIYGAASGTLSGLCLLFAKTGIDLLVLTALGHNQFRRIEAWLIALVLLVAALLQLFYLNRALRLIGPSIVCPLAFCFYNCSSIVSGLIYYNQHLSAVRLGLVVLGTAILLTGVWIVSYNAVSDSAVPEEESRECTPPPEDDTRDYFPHGLTIGLGASSPGFEIRPALQRYYRVLTMQNAQEESPERQPLLPRANLHGDPAKDSGVPDPHVGGSSPRRRRLDRPTRRVSMSGALYVGENN